MTPTDRLLGEGRFRVYWNRHQAVPLVWCVLFIQNNEPQWEVAVRSVVFDRVVAETVFRPKVTPDDEDGFPSGWIEVTGELILRSSGVAFISPLSGDVR